MLSKLAIRRLTKLADYMDGLPKSAAKHFNMGSWFEHNGEHPLGLRMGDVVRFEHYLDCGSTACALGWAATHPYFKKAGLKVIYYQDGWSGDIQFRGAEVTADDTAYSGFLGLTSTQSLSLFNTDVPVSTPKQWAKLCRKFLRENA